MHKRPGGILHSRWRVRAYAGATRLVPRLREWTRDTTFGRIRTLRGAVSVNQGLAPSRRRVHLWAAALLALALTVSCGEDATAPCPAVTNATGVILTSHGRELYREVAGVQQGTLTIPSGGLLHGVECTFVDANAHAIAIANECQTNSVGVESLDPGVASISRDVGLRFFFNVSGGTPGNTTLDLRLIQDGQARFTAQPVPVEVTMPVP